MTVRAQKRPLQARFAPFMRMTGIGLVLWYLGADSVLFAQNGNAGVEDMFRIGADARTMALGNAAAAFPQDPSGFLWNPAGTVVVQQKSILFSHTTLFEDVQYQSINYAHPTLSAGTFGLGVSRIGIGGIRNYEDVGGGNGSAGIPVDMGEISYWWGKLTLAYGATLGKGLSLGTNFVVHRQVMGTASSYGFGMDAGVHYRIRYEGSILDNIYFGASMTNALPARLKLGTQFETLPRTLRIGAAKIFYIRGNQDRFLLIVDGERGQYRKTVFHAGAEYVFQNAVFLRAGADDGKLTFGGGLSLRYFQIDYATGRFGDDPAYFPRSHRFSLIFNIGKSIPEQRRLNDVKRQIEMQRRVDLEMAEARKNRIDAGLKAGREFFDSGDYFRARLELGAVLKEDPENKEASQLLEQTNVKERAFQEERERQLLQETRANESRQKDLAFVNQCFQEGLAFLEKGAYPKAIERWNQALQRDPSNSQITSYISRARVELENEIQKLLGRARQLIRQENQSEAYQVLRQAKELAVDSPKLTDELAAEMKNLDEKFGFLNAYQAGVQRYENKDYVSASQFFQRALELDPKNDKAKELYRNAQARAKGLTKEMGRDTKEKYSQGLRLYQEGNYSGAIAIWEEAFKMDSTNVKILEAIQGAKSRLNSYKKNK
jgi:tetratricopeptide (TPR) repeat protein